MKKALLSHKTFATIALLVALLINTNAGYAVLKTWSGGTGAAKNWTTAGNWTPAGAPAAADDVLFNTAGVITFSTMPVSGSYASLEISNGAVVTFANTACTLTLGSAGANPDFFVAGGGSSLTLGTNVSIILAASATANISGDFFINAGRTFDATAAGVATSVFGTINNAGTVSGTLSTLTFQSGCAYVHNQDGGNIPTATWNATSLCSITGLVATHPTGGNQAFGNLSYNCPGMNTNLTMANGVSVANDFTIANTGSARLLMTNGSFTVGRDIDIQANFTVSGTTDRTLTIVRDASISGGGNVDLCSGIGGNTGTLNIGRNLTSFGAITETGTGKGQLNFNGSTAQVFNQSGAFVNTIGVGINNTAGGVTFSNSVTINDALTLTNGILTIPATTTLTIANGNVIGGSGFGATKHIATAVAGATQGFLRVDNFAVSTPYLFPVGTGTLYLPVTLNSANTLANNTFSVAAFNGVTTNGLPNGTAFSPTQKDKSVDAVWTANYNGAGSPTAPLAVTMTLGWPASLEGTSFSSFSAPQIGISRWSTSWGTCVGTGDNSANTATRTGITSFSPFGVGATPGVLPIKFSYLNASKGNGYNTLNWKAECTGAEFSYVIERSADGRTFAAISTIPANQVTCTLPFSYNDNTVLSGTVFYRIKVINADGISVNSGIVKVGSQAVDIRLAGILPNPVSSTAQLNITVTKKDKVELSIISPEGKVLLVNVLQLQSGSSIVPLEIVNLSKGTYILRGVFGDGQINYIKFVKQ